MTIATILLAAFLAVQAPPPGFSADVLAGQTAPGNATEIRAALARSEAIRAALIVDAARTPEIIDPMEARALRSALGQFDPVSAAQISYFMRGAVTRIAPGPVAGYYSPLLDLWLVTPLERVAGQWRIVAAVLVDGRALRGGGALWSEAPANPLSALTDNHRASIAGFDRRFAGADETQVAHAGQTGTFALLDERTNAWMASLAAWRRNANALQAADAVKDAIAAGRLTRSGVADPGITRQIDGLPASIRRSIAIIGATGHGDATSLFMAAPAAPELLLVLDLDSRNRPTGMVIVNLANLPRTASE